MHVVNFNLFGVTMSANTAQPFVQKIPNMLKTDATINTYAELLHPSLVHKRFGVLFKDPE